MYLACVILKGKSNGQAVSQCRTDSASFMPVGLYPFITTEKGSNNSYYLTSTIKKSMLYLPVL